MSYVAVIRFAPETSAARLNDEHRKSRTLYDTTKLRFLPGKQTVPLLVDHDRTREIGTVAGLMRLQDVDGWWLCAVAELEKCPPWLKRGTRASFQYRELAHDTFGHNICREGLVSEVSVLSPGVEPAEPEAMVLYVKPTDLDHLDQSRGTPESQREQVIRGGGLIRRPSSGVVLGVR